jgi:calcineurin-like phosphoesterase family protein
MDDDLIRRHNDLVRDSDIVYSLGDFCLGGVGIAMEYLSRLKGRIFIIPGGHDHWAKGPFKTFPLPEHVTILPPIYTITLRPPEVEQKLVICMSHYPMRQWDRSHYGSVHFHAHSHGKLGTVSGPRSFDVGVDSVWSYSPVSLKNMVERFRGNFWA